MNKKELDKILNKMEEEREEKVKKINQVEEVINGGWGLEHPTERRLSY